MSSRCRGRLQGGRRWAVSAGRAGWDGVSLGWGGLVLCLLPEVMKESRPPDAAIWLRSNYESFTVPVSFTQAVYWRDQCGLHSRAIGWLLLP